MGKKRVVMMPVEEVDISAVKYQPQLIKAPHITGFMLKIFVWLVELPIFGPIILSMIKRMNDNFNEVLRNTVIPESPMFKPEFPPQERRKKLEESLAQSLLSSTTTSKLFISSIWSRLHESNVRIMLIMNPAPPLIPIDQYGFIRGFWPPCLFIPPPSTFSSAAPSSS